MLNYCDTDDDDDESPLDYSDDDDSEMNRPRTKGEIIGYEDNDQDSEIMDQEQHIKKEVPPK